MVKQIDKNMSKQFSRDVKATSHLAWYPLSSTSKGEQIRWKGWCPFLSTRPHVLFSHPTLCPQWAYGHLSPSLPSLHAHSPQITQANLISFFNKYQCWFEILRHFMFSVLCVLRGLCMCPLVLPVMVQMMCFSLLLIKLSCILQRKPMFASGAGSTWQEPEKYKPVA